VGLILKITAAILLAFVIIAAAECAVGIALLGSFGGFTAQRSPTITAPSLATSNAPANSAPLTAGPNGIVGSWNGTANLDTPLFALSGASRIEYQTTGGHFELYLLDGNGGLVTQLAITDARLSMSFDLGNSGVYRLKITSNGSQWAVTIRRS